MSYARDDYRPTVPITTLISWRDLVLWTLLLPQASSVPTLDATTVISNAPPGAEKTGLTVPQ